MRSARKSVVALLSVASVIVCIGCGPTNGLPPLTGEYLYVANEGDGTVSQFSINTTTGALTYIGNFVTSASTVPDTVPNRLVGGLVVHPTNEFIYVNDFPGDQILSLDIGDEIFSGAIFAQGSQERTSGDPLFKSITPNGQFLYATQEPGGSEPGNEILPLSEYSINLTSGTPASPNTQNGALSLIGTTQPAAQAFGLSVDPTGRNLYVALANESLAEYLILADGTLLAVEYVPLPVFPFLVVTNQPAPSTVCVYALDGVGGESPGVGEFATNFVGNPSYLGNVSLNAPADSILEDIAVHPNQQFIYATLAQAPSNSISVLAERPTLSGSAACSLVLVSAVSAGSDTGGIAIEPSGKFAYSTNQISATIQEFSINSETGALTSIGQVNSESPANPSSFPDLLTTTH
jgi:DNA-binding beta-propeller fold protein YncE